MGLRRLPAATVSRASPSALSLARQKTRGIAARLTISACSSRRAGTAAVTMSAPDGTGVPLRARVSPQSRVRRVVARVGGHAQTVDQALELVAVHVCEKLCEIAAAAEYRRETGLRTRTMRRHVRARS